MTKSGTTKPKKMNQAEDFTLRSIFLSLIATPWLLLVSTTCGLYLKNQTDLNYQYELLYPFLIGFILFYGAGLVIAFLARKQSAFRLLLWAYYLLVPLYIVFQSTAGNATSIRAIVIGNLLLGVFFLGFSIYLSRNVRISKAAPIFTLIGCAFIFLDVYGFLDDFKTSDAAYSHTALERQKQTSTGDNPNIYHIIFDEYQVDLFTTTLTEEVRGELSGFTFFQDTTALFSGTEMSLSSIFSGKGYDFKASPAEYQKAAFSKEGPLLSILKKHGYETHGVMHPVYYFDMAGFDRIAFHRQLLHLDNAPIRENFQMMWLYSVLPEPLVSKIFDLSKIEKLKNKTTLAPSAVIKSYESMANFIDLEKTQSKNNRYQFIHLLIPHHPYILDKDCHYNSDVSTSPIEQAQCATRIMLNFISELKDAGRFEESTIIIQSDHGAHFKIIDGEILSFSQSDIARFLPKYARARSLLLIKPAGHMADFPLIMSQSEASLLDVTPTIVNSLKLSHERLFDGINLLDTTLGESKRQRYFYLYDKKDGRGTHLLNMTRFRIEDGGLINEGLVESGEFK
jgi:KaiC/GvpD/RAD55 family RecA-like ATPase